MSEDESGAGQYTTDDNSSPFVVRHRLKNKNTDYCDCRLTFTSSSEQEPNFENFNLDNFNNNNNNNEKTENTTDTDSDSVNSNKDENQTQKQAKNKSKHKIQNKTKQNPDDEEEKTVEKFLNWVYAICVIQFDLEKGQVLERIYPQNQVLSKQDENNLCYLAFPDSNSGVKGDTRFTFRFRQTSCHFCEHGEDEYKYARNIPSMLGLMIK